MVSSDDDFGSQNRLHAASDGRYAECE